MIIPTLLSPNRIGHDLSDAFVVGVSFLYNFHLAMLLMTLLKSRKYSILIEMMRWYRDCLILKCVGVGGINFGWFLRSLADWIIMSPVIQQLGGGSPCRWPILIKFLTKWLRHHRALAPMSLFSLSQLSQKSGACFVGLNSDLIWEINPLQAHG